MWLKLLEQARLTESCTVTHCVPEENSGLLPYNKFSIDQACLVRTAGCWPSVFIFLCMFMELKSILDHKQTKETLAKSSHLDLTLGN